MDFKKNNYTVLKNVISKELHTFLFDYFYLKRKVAHTLYSNNYIPENSSIFGKWNDPQVPNTYSHYSDIAFETLLYKLLPIIEKQTNLKLYMNYSYARIYMKGDVLDRHLDRFSCEISTTLNLGGDSWPIFINPTPVKEITNSKGIKIDLSPGDMLIYKGNILEHWRETFEGKECAQVFLHYTDKKTKGAKENIFDTRPHLGLPTEFKKI
jgi:hypothetical protein